MLGALHVLPLVILPATDKLRNYCAIIFQIEKSRHKRLTLFQGHKAVQR